MANTVMVELHNPAVPFVGPIPGGLHVGLQILVSGTPYDRFLISLRPVCSIDPKSDCAFVFDSIFTKNQVDRNSFQGGSWGKVESHGKFPFHKGQPCDVTILVKPEFYSVSVNGRHFFDFNHRIPIHRVTHITAEQGISVNSIRFKGHEGYSGEGYPPAGAAKYLSIGGAPIYNPPVPFVQDLGGIYPNKMIFIGGIPHLNASRVIISLQCGHDIIAFHFDVRFNYDNDKNVIVRNTKERNGWGQEERILPDDYFPFQTNMYFDMVILVEPHCFKVAVNKQHLLEFNHRVQPLNRIDTLRIDGDLRLTEVRFQG